MKTHCNLSDSDFKSQFANCSLNPILFNHEAHLRLGWILINDFGLKKAEEAIQKQLKKYVEHVGAQDKYNTTVTVVAMKVINHFMKQSKVTGFERFITEDAQLKNNFKELIEKHYSYNIFKLEKAKEQFVKPDLLPFS